MKKIIIAIDGFSSCGKSTMAKALARNIGYLYFDSGAMYRATALYCMQNDLITGAQIDTEALRARIKDIHITFEWYKRRARDTFARSFPSCKPGGNS